MITTIIIGVVAFMLGYGICAFIVMKRATKKFTDILEESIEESGISEEDIDKILQSMEKRIKKRWLMN